MYQNLVALLLCFDMRALYVFGTIRELCASFLEFSVGRATIKDRVLVDLLQQDYFFSWRFRTWRFPVDVSAGRL